MPIPLVTAIRPGEADAFLPEHLQDIWAVAEPPVVAPGSGQPDALHAEVLRQQRAGLAHLFTRLSMVTPRTTRTDRPSSM